MTYLNLAFSQCSHVKAKEMIDGRSPRALASAYFKLSAKKPMAKRVARQVSRHLI